ncbi:uncharacterized protein BO97DRAFT_232045 [Aspergillus homomorphus CBS 101889]|uniref:Uncharacterized protein n=1 Tax=Aspergillus homomorphus (strain CBS 101889) TaxID=1450537 RepID=A0A395HIX4_ASPHC|nr:hypothetical protein BO97DRAFT_232045 [Aspergillus homomorphus CBS 101889]RAL07871.1 hypothetical protein BO97DRAFT_232045 [Aspergillus homomorphus CBS 101889]
MQDAATKQIDTDLLKEISGLSIHPEHSYTFPCLSQLKQRVPTTNRTATHSLDNTAIPITCPAMEDPRLALGVVRTVAQPNRLVVLDLVQGPQASALMFLVGQERGLVILEDLDLQGVGEDAGDE